VLKGFVVGFLSVLVILVGPGPAFAQPQQWLTYEDKLTGVSIQHPIDWEMTESESGVLFQLLQNGTLVSTSIIAELTTTLPGINTSEEYMKNFMNTGLVALQPPKVLEVNNEVIVGGVPASMVVSVTKDHEGIDTSRVIQYFIFDSEMAYIITFMTPSTDYEQYNPTIQKMVDSFKII
jgi:hypothetical protein